VQNLVSNKIFKNHFSAEIHGRGNDTSSVKSWNLKKSRSVFFIIIAKPRISSVAEVVRAKPCNFLVCCFSSTAVAAKPGVSAA